MYVACTLSWADATLEMNVVTITRQQQMNKQNASQKNLKNHQRSIRVKER